MAPSQQLWRESYDGGSAEAELLVFERLARDVVAIEAKTGRRRRASAVAAFRPTPIAGFENAVLLFRDDLPAHLAAGYARPGQAYSTIVRFSAVPLAVPGDRKRMLGAALRVGVSSGECHDLLMANVPASHARDARQYVACAAAAAGTGQMLGLVRLGLALGPSEALRMIRAVRSSARRQVKSLARETYWSQGAIRWGERLAARYLLRPVEGNDEEADLRSDDPDGLRRELGRRLAEGDVAFQLCIQLHVDETLTPIEDGSVEWTATASPLIPVATLTIPQHDINGIAALTAERRIEQLAFNPWHTTEEFRPLGNLNRARRAIYAASAAHRLGYSFHAEAPLRNRVLSAVMRVCFRRINRHVPWHRLPLHLGLLNLDALRYALRQQNLINAERREAPPTVLGVPSSVGEDARTVRTYDGMHNDLSDPKMGAIGAAFGRNLKPVYRPDLFDTPNPVLVSRQLLDREIFIPARSLNILAAAWIQFQVHDWVNHDRHPLGRQDVVVPLPPGSTWRSRIGGPEEPVMRIAGNKELHRIEATDDRPPILFGNAASHWWDASEVYGPTERQAKNLREKIAQDGAVRDGAKLRLTPEGYLPTDCKGQEVTGFTDSWWLGLSAMHTLFAREHNVLCDALRSEYPHLSDERLYQTARLVIAALIAKIHTVEWTPAILATKAIDIALNSNWHGPRDWLLRLGLWLFDAHALKGIPQTMPDHHTAPYSLTEDFVTVYRMHPLIPDHYQFFEQSTGQALETANFLDIQGDRTDEAMRRIGLCNILYSFGIAHPGAITLHNFPRSLQKFERDGEIIDLSVVDIVRTRRRGVPRYNDFLQGLHKPRARRWEDLSADPESVRRLKEVYKEIDRVDTMVGLFAEAPPTGFGFSDTAFRIFLLMATRRLQSDRFLTVDFRPEIYTPLGMDWIARNGMTSVILRHCPELASVLPRTGSAFSPWRPIVPPQGRDPSPASGLKSPAGDTEPVEPAACRTP